jgi:GMP synthase-like glutamine amidotransferase
VNVALVVANATDSDPGYVGERLEQRGYLLRTVLRDGGNLPTSAVAAGSPALVVLLGSQWSVPDPVDPAALTAECALVRDAVATGLPVLGLCYGAQVVAHATGGRVWEAPAPEVGLVRVETDDPALVPDGPWTAFHTDVLEPPPGATVVAHNGCGVQAFTMPGVLAVQFHPEVRPEVLAGWAARFPELVDAAGSNRDDLLAAARGREAESRVAAYALVDAFLAAQGTRQSSVSRP